MLCLKLGVRAFGWFFLLACGKGDLCRATQQIIQGGLGLGLGGLGLGGSSSKFSDNCIHGATSTFNYMLARHTSVTRTLSQATRRTLRGARMARHETTAIAQYELLSFAMAAVDLLSSCIPPSSQVPIVYVKIRCANSHTPSYLVTVLKCV